MQSIPQHPQYGHGFLVCWSLIVTSTPASVATMYSTQKDSMTISLTVNMWHKMTRIEALLDCGETHNFIDPQTIQALSMGTHPLPHPLIVKNVDGTIYQDGTIMHYCNLWVCQGQQMEKLGFYVANLGRDWVILGYPWFKSYNPDFDWNSNILKGEEVFIDIGRISKQTLLGYHHHPSDSRRNNQRQRRSVKNYSTPVSPTLESFQQTHIILIPTCMGRGSHHYPEGRSSRHHWL